MKKQYLFLLSILLPLLLPVCMQAQRCDTTYLEVFSKSDFDDQRIPCDTFVVMGRGYYQRIALGYNLRGDIVAGQGKVIDNLAYQVQLAKERNDTLQKIIGLTQTTLGKYRSLTDSLESNLDRSLQLNETVIDSTHLILTELRKDHRRQVTGAKWGYGILGGLIGILAGFVAALLIFN
jgi:hypothetical protein